MIQSWEQQTVDEIIAIEKRIEVIQREMAYTEHLMFEQGLFGEYSPYLDERWNKLQEDLYDAQDLLAI